MVLAQILPLCLAQGGRGTFHQDLSSPGVWTDKWEVLQGRPVWVGGAGGGERRFRRAGPGVHYSRPSPDLDGPEPLALGTPHPWGARWPPSSLPVMGGHQDSY